MTLYRFDPKGKIPLAFQIAPKKESFHARWSLKVPPEDDFHRTKMDVFEKNFTTETVDEFAKSVLLFVRKVTVVRSKNSVSLDMWLMFLGDQYYLIDPGNLVEVQEEV